MIQSYSYTISKTGIEPAGVLPAGSQGDHNVTELVFTLEETLKTELASWESEGYTLCYRVDAIDGAGRYLPSVLLTEENGAIHYPLCAELLASGGLARVHLVAARIKGASEERVFYAKPALLEIERVESSGRECVVNGISGALAASEAAMETCVASAQACTAAAQTVADARSAGEAASAAASAANSAASRAESAAETGEALGSELDALIDEAGALCTEIETAETNRRTAEAGRVSAETARQSAEQGRVSAEQTRASAEAEREAAEAERAGTLSNLQAQIDDLKIFTGLYDADLYGVEVDFVNKTFTRIGAAAGKTAGADFDSVGAFGGRRRCNLTDGGVVVAYYGDDAYTETGALTQDVTVGGILYPSGTTVQVMVEQPRFYYKVLPLACDPIEGGQGWHLRQARYYVSDQPLGGFKVHPAFLHGGAENEKIYLSAYEGCAYDVSAGAYILDDAAADPTSDLLSSIAGAKPCSGEHMTLHRANARQMAHNRGTGWEQMYCATLSASQLLMLVEYAAFNMQSAIGAGATAKASGASSNAAELTGASAQLGNASGALTNANEIQIVSYRGEENLWGNIWKFADGINIQNGEDRIAYVADHAFADSQCTAPYESTGFSLAKANGYVSAFGYSEAFDWLFLPSEVIGDSALPVGDNFFQTNASDGALIALAGGSWGDEQRAGPFCWHTSFAPSRSVMSLSARAVYLPNTGSN